MSHRRSARTVPTVWILVADRAAARVYAAEWPSLENFREVADLVNPQGTLHGRDIYPDRFGREQAPDGHGSTDEPPTDIRHYTAEIFAEHIIRRLDEARTHNEIGHLVIIAPPLMLGVLRNHYSPSLRKLIEAEIDKELVQAQGADILEHVRRALPAVPALAE